MEEIKKIIERLSRATGVPVADICGTTRAQLPVAVRHFACLELSAVGYTCEEIGAYINRARVSVYHGAIVARLRLDVQDRIMARVRDSYNAEKEEEGRQ